MSSGYGEREGEVSSCRFAVRGFSGRKGKKGDLVRTVSMETRKAKEREAVALE